MAPAGRGAFQPAEECTRPLGAEQVIETLTERERTRIGDAQRIVIHEPVGQAPTHLPAMIGVVPAGPAQLLGIALA